MTDARKIISDAQQQANNAQARQALSQMDETLSIVAEMRWKMFTAYQRAGFDDEQAMYLVTLDIEGQAQ